ncbi:hypothetical protein Plhal304r1_c011g0042421 [Plasmopara halstedii]
MLTTALGTKMLRFPRELTDIKTKLATKHIQNSRWMGVLKLHRLDGVISIVIMATVSVLVIHIDYRLDGSSSMIYKSQVTISSPRGDIE